MALVDRFKRVWNAFKNPPAISDAEYTSSGMSWYNGPPSRQRIQVFNERSIISSIYTRISIDVADLLIKHIKVDDFGRYLEDMDSPLNQCFTLEANLDQAPRAFRQDIVMTLFDRGCAAIVPVDTSVNPDKNETFDIYSLRVGEILSWYPKHVQLNVYNENKGIREQITLEKRYTAIVENPLYSVMNEPNSTLQRLLRKLALLDAVDEQISSGKLDIIIQLPYVIKSEAKRQQAIARREDIEFQLRGSQYGIAYIDGTEKITQLNRPAENNLLTQVEYLIKMLYNQLGLTEEVMNGTADEAAMNNYFARTIEPIIDAVIEAMQRAFLGPQGTHRKERIKYFKDPFKFVPVADIAEIADKFTRNEILTANEIRQFMGIQPANDPKADELRNSNMPEPTPPTEQPVVTPGPKPLERISQNGS